MTTTTKEALEPPDQIWISLDRSLRWTDYAFDGGIGYSRTAPIAPVVDDDALRRLICPVVDEHCRDIQLPRGINGLEADLVKAIRASASTVAPQQSDDLNYFLDGHVDLGCGLIEFESEPAPQEQSDSCASVNDAIGLNLFRQLVSGKNPLRSLGVFSCNQAEHEDVDCKCFWEQCEAWAKQDAAPASPAALRDEAGCVDAERQAAAIVTVWRAVKDHDDKLLVRYIKQALLERKPAAATTPPSTLARKAAVTSAAIEIVNALHISVADKSVHDLIELRKRIEPIIERCFAAEGEK